ncbi:hypothetical protein [Nocardia sp. NPDC057030]|uniref:hypothetical protein n=1 Tax=unclassified Nocardia TaxID=2637762 RepID=UPI003632BE3B
MLTVALSGTASAAPSPLDATCAGPIHYTFDPPLQNTARETTITWSGTYSCFSTTLPSIGTWGGKYGGKVTTVTGCLQTQPQQVLAQGVVENDKWYYVREDEPDGTSTLTGTVSTVPREDGTRTFVWTGTVTGGTWFSNDHFSGVGDYTSITNLQLCATTGVPGTDGNSTIVIAPV